MSQELNTKIKQLIIALETHWKAYEEYKETNLTTFEQARTRVLLNRVSEFAYEKFLDLADIVALRHASRFLIEEGVKDVPDFSEESPTYPCYNRRQR